MKNGKGIITSSLRFLKGAVFSFILYAVLLLLLAVLSYYFDTPHEKIALFSYSITVICLVFASFLCARSAGEKGWLNGIIGGFVFLLLVFLFSFILTQQLNFKIFLLRLPIFLLIALISGIIAINIK